MAEKEVKKWITVNGKHIPIYDEDSGYESLDKKSYDATKDWFRENGNYNEWEQEVDDVDFNKDEDEWWKFDIPEAIHNYTGERYRPINEYLRDGNFDNASHWKEWYTQDVADDDIKKLDYAIDSFDLKKPLTVYRSADSTLLGRPKMSYDEIRAMVGKTVRDKAYMSASTLTDIPGEQTVGGDIEYVIDVPKGKGNGAYVARFSENSREREFLIRRDSDYEITKVDKNGNLTRVHMKMHRR